MRSRDWSSDVCSSDLIAVAPLRHAIAIGGVADDGGPNEDHQVGLGARPRARLEQFADHGDVRQQRHALDRPALIVVEQPADREDLPVLCGQRRLELALVEDEFARAVRYRPGDRTHFLPDRPLDLAALVDLRLDIVLYDATLALAPSDGMGAM